MKAEPKIEYSHPKRLEKVIRKAYFEDDTLGRLVGKKSFIEVEKEDEEYEVLKGLNNAIIKISNNEVIDGTCRFIVDESDGIKIYPISMFCIVDDNEKYTFY